MHPDCRDQARLVMTDGEMSEYKDFRLAVAPMMDWTDSLGNLPF